MAKYRILSLDGGGIRGLITVIWMQRLNELMPGWLDNVNLIAGTSTGGLLALGVANNLDLQSIRDLYEQKAKQIFDDSWLDNVLDLGQAIGAQYSIKNLERELKKVFGTTTLGDLNKQVLIAAFDLDNQDQFSKRSFESRGQDRTDEPREWKPKLFHNIPNRESDSKELVYKVGLYTSAAPTYFESVEGYIDGGVYANNPSMCAVAQALDSRSNSRASVDDLVLLSIGTGRSLTYIKGVSLDWGYVQWVKPLISLMLDGISGIADFQCAQLLGERYMRLGPAFPEGTVIGMDAVDRIADMRNFAESLDLTATVNWMREVWV